MLRLAVKRNRHRSDVRQKAGNRLGSSQADDLPSYVICDSKAKAVIRHASKGFQDLLGCADCDGRQLMCPATLLQSHVLKEISNQAGLSSEEVASSIHRMANAAEEAVQRAAAGKAMPPVPLLLSHSSGELFTCQISWHKNVHPTLGWSYYTGLVQNISEDISAGRLLIAACKESTYAELCAEWAETAPDGEHFSKQLGSKEEQHAAAEKMWKDELAKGVKPQSASKRREADMSSIWSRSTASTITSSKGSKENKQAKSDDRTFGSHHFGALLGMLPSSSEDSEKPIEEEERPQLPTGETFQSASEDEFEECETMSESSSLSIDSGPPLFDEITDPVKHIDRQCLRQMKQAFILAVNQVNHATTTPDMDDLEGTTGKNLDFPIALRSFGLEESARNWPSGPAWKAKAGSNARDVFQPGPSSGPKAQGLWTTFCECFERHEFFKDEAGSGLALLGNVELALPAGEFAFVQSFHGRLGNPIECLVYVKHVELDDCPFLLAVHSYLNDDYSLEEEFYKLSSELDAVISELASEFFYFAPMRRQRTFRTRIDEM